MNNIGNIIVKGLSKNKPKLKAENGFILPFYQDKNTIKNLENYNRFIKGTEKLIRSDTAYRGYKDYLMREIGLDRCAVLSLVQSKEDRKVTIEMHHGPILTLYDCCDIVTKTLIKNGENVTSFRVADIVIKEHYNNVIPVVMLTKTLHQLVHAGKIYINLRQAWAWNRMNIFLEKYKDGIDDRMRELLIKNIKTAKQYNSTDNGILEIRKIKNWNE